MGSEMCIRDRFIPNLTFPEPVEMGENVWIYMGELCPAYCLFTPWETKEN